MELGLNNIELSRLFYETTIGCVKGTPRWGQRAHSAVFDFNTNALIYMGKTEEMGDSEKMM